MYVEQLYTDAALVLDASTRVAAASGSGAIDLHFMHKHTVDFSPFSAHLMLCENVDLARLTSVCDAEQLYTDAAPVLAGRIYTRSSGLRKRRHRSTPRTVDCSTFSVHDLMLEVLRER